MLKKNVLLSITVLVSIIFLSSPALGSLDVSTTTGSVSLLSGENFSVVVHIDLINPTNPILKAEYNEDLIEVISPEKIIELWDGTFSADITYDFITNNWGNDTLKFILQDDSESKEVAIPVDIAPVYVELETISEIEIEEGESFEVPIKIISKNSENVKLVVIYNENYFEAEYDDISGNGTFEKDGLIIFTSKEIKNNPNQEIILRVCSERSCDERKIGVKIKNLFIDAQIDGSVDVGSTFSIDTKIKNFNHENAELGIEYDENWFDLLSHDFELEENSLNEKTFYFRLREGDGCPDPNIELSLESDEEMVDETVSVTINPASFIEIEQEESLLEEGENFTVSVDVKTINMVGSEVKIEYEPEYFELTNPEDILIEDWCVDQRYDFIFTALESSENDTEISATLSHGETLSKKLSKPVKIVGKKSTEHVSFKPKKIPPGQDKKCKKGYYDAVKKKCVWNPPLEIICGEGEYNETTETCQWEPDLEVVCPENYNYNESTDYCELRPEEQIICENGIYNSTIEKCVVTSETICDNSEAIYENGTCTYLVESEAECDRENAIYNETTGECIYEIESQAVCINLNATYNENTGFCEWNPTLVITCNQGEYDDGVCRVEPETEVYCGDGTYDEDEDVCILTSEEICSQGTYNSDTGTCEWYPDIEIICEEGNYDEETGKCIVTPEVEINSKVGETVALTLKLTNNKDVETEITNALIATDDEIKPEVIDIIMEDGYLDIDESEEVTALLRYDEDGSYTVNFKILNDAGDEIVKTYNINVEPKEMSTGTVVGVIILALMAVGFSVNYLMKRNPWRTNY